MKKLAFVILVAFSFLYACSGKKKDANENAQTPANADTIVIDYGTVNVDSISPDSAQVSVTDTSEVIIATPENQTNGSKKKNK